MYSFSVTASYLNVYGLIEIVDWVNEEIDCSYQKIEDDADFEGILLLHHTKIILILGFEFEQTIQFLIFLTSHSYLPS